MVEQSRTVEVNLLLKLITNKLLAFGFLSLQRSSILTNRFFILLYDGSATHEYRQRTLQPHNRPMRVQLQFLSCSSGPALPVEM